MNIRSLRETHACTLPIEVSPHITTPGADCAMQVYYAGPEEMPVDAVVFLETSFADVRVIDITTMPELPANLDMKVCNMTWI